MYTRYATRRPRIVRPRLGYAAAVFLFLLLLPLATPDPAAAQTRRALLVGINTYIPSNPDAAPVADYWTNLQGAVNDVDAMRAVLINRMGFAQHDIRTLTNAQATREGILRAIREHLLYSSEAGSTALFYFAGHGSLVLNSGTDPHTLEKTLVPADGPQGAQDIRISELHRLFNSMLEDSVEVTLILDTSHRESDRQGLWPPPERYVLMDPYVVCDTSVVPPSEEQGALVLSAARDDEAATELVDGQQYMRGAFSWAFTRTLRSEPADLSATDLLGRIRTQLIRHGITQTPTVAGPPHRLEQPIFNHLATAPPVPGWGALAASAANSSGIELHGGYALGLRSGTELTRLSPTAPDAAPLAIRVDQVDGAHRAFAQVIAGNQTTIRRGDFFRVDRWVLEPAPPLRLWIPPANRPYETLVDLAHELKRLSYTSGVTWVLDPVETPPTHVIYWDGAQWRLRYPHTRDASEPLGRRPSAPHIQQLLGQVDDGPAALYLHLPPPTEFGRSLRINVAASNRKVVFAASPEQADYLLAGRLHEDVLGYAWIHRHATFAPTSGGPPRRSLWIPAPDRSTRPVSLLTSQMERLDTAWNWLHLESPPYDRTFPYRIAGLERTDAPAARKHEGDLLHAGERYRLVLEATSKDLAAACTAHPHDSTARHLYAFALNSQGEARLLYPSLGDTTNIVTLTDTTRTKIALTRPGQDYLFEVNHPAGINTFMLLATEEPFDVPSIFTLAESNRHDEESPAHSMPLTQLLYDLAHGQRTEDLLVPATWFLDRLQVRALVPPEYLPPTLIATQVRPQ